MSAESINFNLPKVALGTSGAIFLIDAENRRLIKHRASGEGRVIIDLNSLPEVYGQKLLIYSTHEHKHVDIPLTKAAKMEGYDLIVLPEKLLSLRQVPLDDECYEFNQSSSKNGWGFFVADQDTCDRIQGKLAILDIAGQEFFIDMRMWQLRPKDEFSSYISLEDIGPWQDGDIATFLYDTRTKFVFNPHWDVASAKADIVAVQTRSINNLDPVGFARRLNREDGYFLDRSVFLARQQAKILPIEKTEFRDVSIKEEVKKNIGRKR